jgi:hypothetical protein
MAHHFKQWRINTYMSLLNTNLPRNEAPKINSNVIKWSGYFATTKQAEDHLREQTSYIEFKEDKIIISAKLDFVNRHFKGYFLYRFTVVLAEKQS